MQLIRILFASLLLALPAAHAQTPAAITAHASVDQAAEEAAIRALISNWYTAQRATKEGRPDLLLAPGAINVSPGYHHVDTGAASLGPRVYTSLAATALDFRHEITRLVIDPGFARVHVRERGYSYAWAAQKTTEAMGAATFVLERQSDGRWLILAHETHTTGFPPSLKTDPMPDLRALFYATTGKDRDPVADARAAANF